MVTAPACRGAWDGVRGLLVVPGIFDAAVGMAFGQRADEVDELQGADVTVLVLDIELAVMATDGQAGVVT